MSIYFTGPNSMYEPITEQRMYSDSTPMIKTGGWSRIVAKADTMTVTGGSMAQFINAMFLVDAITTSGGVINKLVIPYVPGARQDRTNPTGDVLQTARSVANMINERWFDEVVVLDPHSPVVTDTLDYPVVYPQSEVAKMLPKLYAGVIAADKGGKQRAVDMASAMGIPVYYGGKTRDVSTGQLTGFTLENLDNKLHYGNGHYLVVDDICDGGGTFNGLASKIHEQGATADLYVSHGLFSKGTHDLLDNYERIYTTDSLDQRNTLEYVVLPVVKAMEKYNA